MSKPNFVGMRVGAKDELGEEFVMVLAIHTDGISRIEAEVNTQIIPYLTSEII